MVVVASYPDPDEAERTAARLRNAGIECTIDDEACSGMHPHWSPEHGGFSVRVAREVVMTALSLLEAEESGELLTNTSEQEDA